MSSTILPFFITLQTVQSCTSLNDVFVYTFQGLSFVIRIQHNDDILSFVVFNIQCVHLSKSGHDVIIALTENTSIYISRGKLKNVT